MTNKQAVKIIKKVKPASYDDLLHELQLLPLSHGCFRSAYLVKDTGVVVKFTYEYLPHARNEIRVYRKIMRRKSLYHLRRYLPRVYYTDYKRGVIAMEYINTGEVPQESCSVIEKMFRDTFPSRRWGADISSTNLGYNNRGQIKVVDWGCV